MFLSILPLASDSCESPAFGNQIIFSTGNHRNERDSLTPILRIGDQVLTFDVFWPKHLQEVRSTVYIHVQSI